MGRALNDRDGASGVSVVRRAVLDRIGEPFRWMDIYRGKEDFCFPGTWHLLDSCSPKPDIIHCHNLHGGYFDLRALPWLSTQAPLVLTLHDAWLFSGHCAHSLECSKWRTGCEICGDLSLFPPIKRDAAAFNWRRKRDILAGCRLYVSAPCNWLLEKAKSSILAPSIIEARAIPNGVDLAVFRSDEREAARRSLSIPDDAIVLLFAGKDVRNNVWKDFAAVEAAVGALAGAARNEHLLFICLGDSGPQKNVGNVTLMFVPFEKDETSVARYFKAADVYLHPSRADTFPTTIIEAFACAVPVVASNVGGIPEQVDDGVNGFLVEPGDTASFVRKIELLVKNSELRSTMGRASEQAARSRFNVEHQAEAYLSWFRSILNQN